MAHDQIIFRQNMLTRIYLIRQGEAMSPVNLINGTRSSQAQRLAPKGVTT